MKNLKRALSLMLCFIMVLGLLPMTASAAGADGPDMIQKIEITLSHPEFTDAMTGNQAKETVTYSVSSDCNCNTGLGEIYILQGGVNQTGTLEAGKDTAISLGVYASPFGRDLESPDYDFDSANLDSIEVWVNGIRRTDAIVKYYNSEWRSVRVDIPVTVSPAPTNITHMEFSVSNLKVGEKGTAVTATVADYAPITLSGMASLRYDDAGAAGNLVKTDLLEKGQIYWLCINPVVKDGYTLNADVMQTLDSWTVNGLPRGMDIDQVVVSGSQVRFRLTPLLEEISRLEFTALRAPQLGQTVDEYYDALDKDLFNGTFKINGLPMDENYYFGNIAWDGGWLCDGTKTQITDVSQQITEGTYYKLDVFYPVKGFTFANDLTVTVPDVAGVEAKFDGVYLLVYVKYEVTTPVVEYSVTFNSDGGSAVTAQTVEEGKAAVKPADPIKAGHTFLGWYLGENKYDFSKPVTGNLTLKAKWEAVPTTYTITFDPNGGSVTPTSMVTDTDGRLASMPMPTHPDSNMMFDGWHTNKNSYSHVADKCKFTKDTTLYAHWKEKPAHTVAEVYIESVQIPVAGVMPSNHVTITTTGVHGITDSGDTFWVRYDAATNDLTDVYEDDTFVDSVPFRSGETYLLMLAIEAQPDYGFIPDVKVFYKGVELPAPSMSDITASCLLESDDEYILVLINPSKLVTTTYTVTFDSDGGSAVAAQTVEEGKAAAKPADPSKDGYTFQGWYLGDSKYDFSKPVAGNITLKAKWEKISVPEDPDVPGIPGDSGEPGIPAPEGWVLENGNWVFYENGAKVTNQWRKDSVGWCYLGSDGAMLTNCWLQDSKGWCYIGADGYCETNCWKLDSYGWLYLDSEGSMTKNAWVGGYYLDSEGYMATNRWIYDNGYWYYVDGNGLMVTNAWRKDSYGWCYLGSDGAMVTNCWLQDSKGWCYIGSDGYCETNCWKQDSYGWLYLDSEGSMTKDEWILYNGDWYYLDEEGYMVTGEENIHGTWYTFNDSGVWIG